MLFFLLNCLFSVVHSLQVEYQSVIPSQDNQLFILDLHSAYNAAHYASWYESKSVRRRVYIPLRSQTISNSLPLTAIVFNMPIPDDVPAFQLLRKDERETFYVSRHFCHSNPDLQGLQPEVLYFMNTVDQPLRVPTFQIDRDAFYKMQWSFVAQGLMEMHSAPLPPDHLQAPIKRLKRLENYHYEKWPKNFVSFNMAYAMIRHKILSTMSIQNSARAFRKYWPKSVLKCFIFPKGTKVRPTRHTMSYFPTQTPVVIFWDSNSLAPTQSLHLAGPSVIVQLMIKKCTFLWLLMFSPEQPDAKVRKDLVPPHAINKSFNLFHNIIT